MIRPLLLALALACAPASAQEAALPNTSVQALDLQSFASALCHALAIKLMNDEQLQGELMDMVEAGEQAGEQAD